MHGGTREGGVAVTSCHVKSSQVKPSRGASEGVVAGRVAELQGVVAGIAVGKESELQPAKVRLRLRLRRWLPQA